MKGGGIPGGPMPIGAAAMKPGGIAPGGKPICDDGGGYAGGGIIGGAIRVFSCAAEFGDSIANSTISNDTSTHRRAEEHQRLR